MIIYHANCVDGFTSNWVARKAFPSESLEFIPMHYKQPPPDVTGKDVYICDFSFPRQILLDMEDKAAKLVVMDHHKTAKEDLEGLDFCIFDMDRSGAAITWDYFAWNKLLPVERHWLVDYVQDRDLWTWKLPRSREVSDAISCRSFTFEAWDEMASKTAHELAQEGEAISKYKATVLEMHVNQAYITVLDGHEVPAVNASTLNSELGNILSRGYPFAVAWSYLGEGMFRYSLRATSYFDCALLAAKFKGGGHQSAAGFTSNQFLVPALRKFKE
jgi:oligoribonuclease NrnB/cAMP/cGMP phosphodiesterase (DHH superfamily)